MARHGKRNEKLDDKRLPGFKGTTLCSSLDDYDHAADSFLINGLTVNALQIKLRYHADA